MTLRPPVQAAGRGSRPEVPSQAGRGRVRPRHQLLTPLSALLTWSPLVSWPSRGKSRRWTGHPGAPVTATLCSEGTWAEASISGNCVTCRTGEAALLKWRGRPATATRAFSTS